MRVHVCKLNIVALLLLLAFANTVRADQLLLARLNNVNDKYMLRMEAVLSRNGYQILQYLLSSRQLPQAQQINHVNRILEQCEAELRYIREVDGAKARAVLGAVAQTNEIVADTWRIKTVRFEKDVRKTYALIRRRTPEYFSYNHCPADQLNVIYDVGKIIVHMLREYAWDTFRSPVYLREVEAADAS